MCYLTISLPREEVMENLFTWPRKVGLPERLLMFPEKSLPEEVPLKSDENEMELEPERWDGMS